MLGYHCSHENHAPSELLRIARLAEIHGCQAAMWSDHFMPWRESGQSGYTWSWLGAAMQANRLSYGKVCAPGQRYHPAIIAQAVATLGEMFPERIYVFTALRNQEAFIKAFGKHVLPNLKLPVDRNNGHGAARTSPLRPDLSLTDRREGSTD